jgi:mannosyltransferase OCH1-like enzyme
MIPKKLHIVWLGDEMPEKEKNFLQNNKKVLDGYEINLWGNDTVHSLIANHPIENFVHRAIEIKKYAFASDAIKLIALDKHGGWSIDSDNEILQTFDSFLEHSWVSGFEKYKHYSPITAIWGAIPNHKFTKLLIQQYLDRDFEYLIWKPNTKWITEILLSYGARNDNTQQRIEELDIDLYPDYVFCGPHIEGKTYALHHFKGSWL